MVTRVLNFFLKKKKKRMGKKLEISRQLHGNWEYMTYKPGKLCLNEIRDYNK